MSEDVRAGRTDPASAQLTADVDAAHELDLYRRMLLIRRFEERVYLLYLQGELPGTLHQSQGQEAVAVGFCDVLRRTDWITSTDLRAVMAELYGKATGCCGGKGGSMHLGDPSVGMLPAIAIVGGGNTVVTGLGLAFKLMRTDQVAVCFFGEGASNEGAFHEGLNFAAVQHLPIVFACENNLYGASTPFQQVSLVPDVASRAAAYGVRGEIVDGMDVLAVREAAGRAVAEARAGAGPVLLECKTYRFAGHSRGDVRGYRSREEEAEWKERDPIVRLRERLAVTLDEGGLDAMDAQVEAALEDAIEFARNSPLPRADDALTDAYATVIRAESTS
jgi:TPP-dependent pyruvate/acetoin dehydrogenase alpha subunit